MSRALFAALLVVLVAVVLFSVGFEPFESNAPIPESEITSLEITDRGCQEDIRDFARLSNGANGSFFYAETIDSESAISALSAQILRTSPTEAAIATYRLDVETHSSSTDTNCPRRIAFRVEFNASSGSEGSRVVIYVDGHATGCTGGTSGPDSSCHRLMVDDTTTHWTNTSNTEDRSETVETTT